MPVNQKGVSRNGGMEKNHVVQRFLYRGSLGILLSSMFVMATLAPAVSSPVPLRITIGTFFPYYSPSTVRIGFGTPIFWENPTADLHSITHDACRTHELCAFDSGALGPNRTFTLNQLPPGYYPYYCTFHPIMRGVLVVHEPDPSGET